MGLVLIKNINQQEYLYTITNYQCSSLRNSNYLFKVNK